MQFLVISHQLWEILFSIIIGLCLGFAYDILRFVRRFFSPLGFPHLLANILDVVFGIVCGGVYCIFVYFASSGRFRWFTALGMFLGFLLYRLLPGRLIKPLLFFVADKIQLFVCILLFPIKRAASLFICFVRRTASGLKRRVKIKKTEKIKRDLYSDISIGIE